MNARPMGLHGRAEDLAASCFDLDSFGRILALIKTRDGRLLTALDVTRREPPKPEGALIVPDVIRRAAETGGRHGEKTT